MQNYNIPASAHRDNARKMLGGNIFSNLWMMALLIMFIYSLISSTASSVTGGVAALIITGPLLAGISMCFLHIARRGKTKFEMMFSGFESDFAQNLLIGLMTYLLTFLWSLLFIIPGIVKSYSYSMAYYVKCDNPTYDWKQCIDESQYIMGGKKWKLFCLDLSFIGWMFVSWFTCGVGFLWLVPYMQAAHTSFYESIKRVNYNGYAPNDQNNYNPNI